MKHRIFLTLLGTALAVAIACGHFGRGEKPLLLSNDNPVRLSDNAADNSRCHVCHLNYAHEELAVTHANAKIGCEDCHGESDAHCGDENNITPPERMYAQEAINPACMLCHPKVILLRTKEHEPVLAGTAKEKYCTDCHGEHRLTQRTRRWDKKTGKLIDDDGVRVMDEDAFK